MALVLDLETVGEDVDIEPVSAPANYKDPQKIADYIAQAEFRQREQASLYPWSNRIIALGWCEETDEVPHVELANNHGAEARILSEFWGRVVDRHGYVVPIVTFGGRRFDLLVLMARSRLLGVKYPELNVDRYRSPHPDLMSILTFNGAVEARTLKWYCRRFGIDVSDAFSGALIAQLHADGDWEAIRMHCASDVNLVRQLGEKCGVLKKRPAQVIPFPESEAVL